MLFWGAKVSPKKPFKLSLECLGGGRLHLSQATLGLNSSGSERTVIACKIGDDPKSLLCSLIPGVMETCSLNLLFDEEVLFSVVGSSSIHLTGYHLPAENEDEEDEYDDDFDEEDEYDDDFDEEDEYDDDFIVHSGEDESSESMSSDESEDIDLEDSRSASATVHHGVKIEEIFDEPNETVREPEKANVDVKLLHSQKAASDEEECFQERPDVLQKQDSPHTATTSEAEVMHNQGEEKEDERSEDEDGLLLPQKRKTLSSDAEKQVKRTKPDEQSFANLDSSKKKRERKKKKKKLKDRQIKQNFNEDSTTDSAQLKTLGYGKNANSQKLNGGALGEKEEGDLFVKAIPSETKSLTKTSDKVQPIEANEQTSVHQKLKGARTERTPAVKRYPNGFEVEEISMGKPDGKQAKPGKRVLVYYVGKLKTNGNIFDDNRGKKPFEFRLGVGEVIKGWDLGINGMRVGDRRRLTIPPQMGYGASGVPKTIPKNAWLVFEVELVNVK